MTPRDLFGDGDELAALEQLVNERAGTDETEDGLVMTPILSLVYCTPVLSLVLSC